MLTRILRTDTLLHLTLNGWSREEQWILFSENLNVSLDFVSGNTEISSGETKFTVPQGTIHYDKTKQNKSKFWKTRWDSSDCIGSPLITCNSGQHFAGNNELFPVWRHSFRNVARSWHLKQFHCQMSCDHELANEWARCSGKTPAV